MNNKSKRILLLTAPRPAVGQTPLHYGDNRPPQGLGFIAAYLEKHGHEARIVDLYHFGSETSEVNPGVQQEESFTNLSIDLDEEIRSFRPDYIGMYIHTMSYYTACNLGEELKRSHPGITLLCGGPHPTVLPETIPDCFDHVVVGEGEYVSLDIVEGRNSGRIIQGVRVENLDELPWPDFDEFMERPYNWKLNLFGNKVVEPVLSLNTTRGCPFACKFCGVQFVSGPGFRGISPDRLVDKLIELRDRYELKGVYFREDNFTVEPARLDAFCDLMVDREVGLQWACESRVKNLSPRLIRKMSKAGCRGLYIGVESGSPRMLELMEKEESVEDFLEKIPILHENDIKTYTTWIYGLPEERKEDRRMSEDLMKRLGPTSYDRFVYIGLPVSHYYNKIKSGDDYEYMEESGIIYPKGYLSLATQLYGKDDPRNRYVEEIYRRENIEMEHVEF